MLISSTASGSESGARILSATSHPSRPPSIELELQLKKGLSGLNFQPWSVLKGETTVTLLEHGPGRV